MWTKMRYWRRWRCDSDDFYHKQYGILFDAMIELYSKDSSRPHYLTEQIKEKEVLEEISKSFYVKTFWMQFRLLQIY